MSRGRRAAAATGLATLALVLLPHGAAAQDWPRESPPRPLPSRPIAFPPYQLKTLSNGLQVLVIPQHEEPSVSLRLLIKAGSAQDPADKPGVANFMANLLDQGTTSKSAQAIADLVESSGGILGVGAGNELSFVNAGVVKDRFDALLDLTSEIAQRPAFSPAEIDRQRQQLLSGMQVTNDDPQYVATLVFDRLVYGFHPYGRPGNGTPASVPKITREDLVAFHRAWFVPNNAFLAIVGDVTADEAFASAERAFGKWAGHDVPKVTPMEPPPPTMRIVVIDKPGSVQTEIRVGQLAVPRTHRDYIPLDLAMRVLGGEGANRLFGVLRTDRGLTYGASAELRTFKSAGALVAETNTRSAATGEVLRLVVDEFWRIRRERVDPRELAGAEDYLSGSFPLTVETSSAIALQVLNQLFYGMPLKDLETYRDRVNQVGVDDIVRVAQASLQPDRLAIVLVGDASTFVDQLKAQGFSKFERIPISELDLNSPDLRRGGKGSF